MAWVAVYPVRSDIYFFDGLKSYIEVKKPFSYEN